MRNDKKDVVPTSLSEIRVRKEKEAALITL
jgi:hypothetical protein